MPEEPQANEKMGPQIRTMKSDVSEFLKETKPSLIQILTTQVEAERRPKAAPAPKRPQKAIPLGLGLFILFILGGYLGYRFFQIEPVKEARLVIPQPFFSVEASQTVEVPRQNFTSLPQQILKYAATTDRPNSFRRLVILTSDEGGARHIRADEFLRSSGVKIPEGIYPALQAVMPSYYQAEEGVRMLVVFKTDDPKRVFGLLLRTEASLVEWWTPLFLEETPTARIAPFEDRVWRNIGYRMLPLEPERDLNLIYGIFPAKNYIIITSSEAAFKEAVNRLFEAS